MRVQMNRFENSGWAVLLPYPEGGPSFDATRKMLSEPVAAGDVFEVRFERDPEETERIAAENRRLLGELLGDER
jgi:DUF3006 family protein